MFIIEKQLLSCSDSFLVCFKFDMDFFWNYLIRGENKLNINFLFINGHQGLIRNDLQSPADSQKYVYSVQPFYYTNITDYSTCILHYFSWWVWFWIEIKKYTFSLELNISHSSVLYTTLPVGQETMHDRKTLSGFIIRGTKTNLGFNTVSSKVLIFSKGFKDLLRGNRTESRI